MSWFRRRKLESIGSVLFRGSLPPRAEDLDGLRRKGVELTATASGADQHWALAARHPDWGEAKIICPREALIPPDDIVDLDPRLLPEEREQARLAETSVVVAMDVPDGNILEERKHLLRYLHAIVGEHGLVALDHAAQALWSRADLEDELAHDAELDILALFTVHALTRDDGSSFWMHTHGLQEIGHFDFDILEPSADLRERAASLWDLVRAIALAIVEGNATADGDPLEIVGGRTALRFVSAARFLAESGGDHPEWRAELDPLHTEGRAIVCEPAGGWLGLWRGRPRPSRWLSGPLGETDLQILFSDASSELMARRARATWEVFRRAHDELRGLELPALVKLRYESTGGAVEHLWFDVAGCRDDGVDATLINDPWNDIGFANGDRRWHDLERLSDWTILTPAGPISPRSTRTLRLVREHREELEAALRQARSSE